MSGTPAFETATQGLGALYHLALIANGACIHESCKTVENKNLLMSTGASPIGYTTRPSTQGTGKNAHDPVST